MLSRSFRRIAKCFPVVSYNLKGSIEALGFEHYATNDFQTFMASRDNLSTFLQSCHTFCPTTSRVM